MPRYEEDGSVVVLSSQFKSAYTYVLTGAADSATLGRGKGTAFTFYADPDKGMLSTYPAQTFTQTFSFLDPVLVTGGMIFWEGAQPGDTLDLLAQAPASTVTPALDGKGNVNLQTIIGPAAYILPAQGNGTHNLINAVPVPARDKTVDRNPNGNWEFCDTTVATQITTPDANNTRDPNTGPGTVLPSYAPNQGTYNLLTVGTTLERFVVQLPLLGSGRTIHIQPQIRPKRMLSQYVFQATCYNSGHAGLRVSYALEIGRVQTL